MEPVEFNSLDIKKAISLLVEGDDQNRSTAAGWIFQHGFEQVETTLNKWLKDIELAKLLRFHWPRPFGEAGKYDRLPMTVGLAVTPKTFERIRSAYASPQLAQVPPDQDAMEFELHFGLNVHLDILTTKAPGGGGAIDKFLQKFGEGIQQIEYLVPDVDRATELLRERFGIRPIYPQTRAGADGTRVNFFLVSTPDGKKVLIELVEQKK